AFECYYGFLCVRHILQITCLSVLRGANSLAELLESLGPNASWDDVSQAVATKALNILAESSADAASFDETCLNLTDSAFVVYRDEKERSYSLLQRLLAVESVHLIELYSYGMLPGCALFLLASWRMLLAKPEDK
ncbi:hypothetical protein FRC07_010459, partial [Ceratobasidium sp. 392]